MEQTPCDDEDCWCCHPENMHSCSGPPAQAEVGETYTCTECGVVWTCKIGRPSYVPVGMRFPDTLWWEADRKIPTIPELERRHG